MTCQRRNSLLWCGRAVNSITIPRGLSGRFTRFPGQVRDNQTGSELDMVRTTRVLPKSSCLSCSGEDPPICKQKFLIPISNRRRPAITVPLSLYKQLTYRGYGMYFVLGVQALLPYDVWPCRLRIKPSLVQARRNGDKTLESPGISPILQGGRSATRGGIRGSR